MASVEEAGKVNLERSVAGPDAEETQRIVGRRKGPLPSWHFGPNRPCYLELAVPAVETCRVS